MDAAQSSLAVLRVLFGEAYARRFSIRLWDGTRVASEGREDFAFCVNSPDALRAALARPTDLPFARLPAGAPPQLRIGCGWGTLIARAASRFGALGEATFDKIVSVGMFEHVGHRALTEYFKAVFRALRPGGLFLNHGIANQDPAYRSKTGEETFRAWRLYMAGSAHGFRAGRMGLFQTLLARAGAGGRVGIPSTRRDLIRVRNRPHPFAMRRWGES